MPKLSYVKKLVFHRYHHTDTDTDTRLMIHTYTNNAQTSILIPIPGIVTNDIPGIGIGTIPILELIPILDKDSYRY